MTHQFKLRVYYEDTDLAGIVYYANYLKFIERARTEFIRDLGVDQTKMKSENGIVFAVRRLEADYLLPAMFDDELIVETSVEIVSGARIVLKQVVTRQGAPLFCAIVTLIALAENGSATRMPADIRRILS